MGLDWTAALVPGERPSWCSATQQPVPPPSAFALPQPTIAYLKDSDPKGAERRVKRVAMWGWEETEWRVVVKKEGEDESKRVERPLPVPKEDGTRGGGSGAKLFKAAERMMEAPRSASTASSSSAGTGGKPRSRSPVATRTGSTAGEDHSDGTDGAYGDSDDITTDTDGWIYGDNKWENRGNKGGMGKVSIYCFHFWLGHTTFPRIRHINF